jgi:hypothetical protein
MMPTAPPDLNTAGRRLSGVLQMNARLVNESTRLTIVGLITALACGGVWIAHRGLFALLEGNIEGFGGRILLAALLALASYLLAQFRNDLIDE